MNDLHKALGDISNIRKQVAHSTEFRGYGPATMAATAAIACLAAGIQAVYLPSPGEHIVGYVGVWVGMAILSAALTGVQMYTRSRRLHSSLSGEMIQMAVEQFLPSAAAGLLITVVLLRAAPAAAWILPGIWQVIFGLGIFSSCRFLPRPMLTAGFWYLATGLMCVGIGDSRSLAPWTMGISYGVGQLLVAGVLFFAAREANDESQD